MSDTMLARFFAINIKPEHRDEFVKTSIFEVQSVLSEEPRVLQFYFLTDTTNANRFYFYEVFEDEAAIEEHWKTEAFKSWWMKIEPMIDGNVEILASMRPLFPSEKGFRAQKSGLLQW